MRYRAQREWPVISRNAADIARLFTSPESIVFQTSLRSLLHRDTPICSLDLEFNENRPTILGVSDGVLHISVSWEEGSPWLVELLRDRPDIYWLGHFLISADIQVLEKEGITIYRENVSDLAIWHWLCGMHLCKGTGKTEDGQDKRGKGYMNLWSVASLYTNLANWKGKWGQCRGIEDGCDGIRPCNVHSPFAYNGTDSASVALAMPNVVRKARLWRVDHLHDLHRDLLWTFQQMTNYGVKVDVQYVQKLREELTEDKLRIEQRLPFNPKSSQQVVGHFKKKGIVLEDATEESVREAVEDGHEDEELSLVLEHKELGNGPDRWFGPKFVGADERIHCRLGLWTSSARMLAADPNLNNVGKRRVDRHNCKCGQPETEHVEVAGKKVCAVSNCTGFSPMNVGKKLRRAIVASEGMEFIDADLKNGENRVYLYLAGYTPPEEDFHDWMTSNIGIDNSHPFAMALGSARDAAKSVTHCLTGDHEVLTPRGWKRIDACNENTVLAQWDVNGSQISFVKAEKFHEHNFSGELVRLNTRGLQTLATENHAWPVNISGTWNKIKYNKTQRKTFSQLSSSGRIAICGELSGPDFNISDDNIRRCVAIQADAVLRSAGGAVFHVVKERKKERLKMLFGTEGVPCGCHPTGRRFNIPISMGFTYPLLNKEKSFTEKVLFLSQRQREIFLEEILLWDGCVIKSAKQNSSYCNTDFSSVVLIQTLAHLSGRQSLMREVTKYKSGFAGERCKRIWRLSFNRRQYAAIETMKTSREPFTGKVYCFTVPSGYFLIRYRDTISVTGNSTDYGEGLQLRYPAELRSARIKKEIDVGARIVFPNWTFRGKVVTFTGVNMARRAFGEATFANRRAGLDIAERYMARFPQLRDLQKRIMEQIEKEGGVKTAIGYVTRLYGTDEDIIKSGLAIYGSQPVAHILKIALNDLQRKFDNGSQLRPLLPIHDEILCEAPFGNSAYFRNELRAAMEREMKEMPGMIIPADPSNGPTWAELRK